MRAGARKATSPRFLLTLASALGFACGLAALPPERLALSIGERPAPEILASQVENYPERTSTKGDAAFGTRSESGYSLADFGDRALVLCWHSFLGDPAYDTDFSLSEFASQLDELRALGYSFLTLDDYFAARIKGRLNVIVTIDDGHRTVPEAIAKVLAPRGIVPTLFVYPAVLGTTDFAMTDTELSALAATGIPAGAHGYHHLRVNEALYKESPSAFMEEIYKAKLKAESLSKSPVLAYAYPFGVLSPRTELEVEKAGFAAGFAVRPGFVYSNPYLNDSFDLPRLVVLRSTWKETLALLERNAADPGSAESGFQDGAISGR